MKIKKMKTIIISIIISLTVILLIVVLAIFKIITDDNYEGPTETEIGKQDDETIMNEETGQYEARNSMIIDSFEYMTVRNCIQRYINTINFSNMDYYIYDNDKNEYTINVTENEISKNAYDLLSTKFIKDNNIKDTEVFKYINKVEKSGLLTIVTMKELRNDERIKSIAVNVALQYLEDLKPTQIFYVIVNLDNQNETYSIEPINVKSIKDIQLVDEVQEIKPNENNGYEYPALSDIDIIQECMDRYKRISFISPEFVYNNILDKEYREKRFGNAEKFKEYVETNRESIKSINIKKYQSGDYDSQAQYVCIDQNGKYYIFRKTSILDCSLLLDTYSIDIPEFIEKYDSASETDKVGLNANKIVEAVNNKDYEYIYNKLNESFRNSNFSDIGKFEEFINNTFYKNTVMKNAQCKQEGNTYVFTMQISDQEGTEKLKDVVILMQLLDNRDFVISFAK